MVPTGSERAARPGIAPGPAPAPPVRPRAGAPSAAALAIALAIALGALGLVYLLARPLALLLGAIVIGQALGPLVARLERWLPRTAAVVLVYVALILTLAVVGWLTLPLMVEQARTLVVNAPALIGRGRRWFDRVDPAGADQIIAAIQTSVDRFTRALVDLPLTVVSSALEIVLVLFMSAYWLLAAPALRRFALSLFPEERRDRATDVLTAVGQTMGGYVRATAINASIVVTLVYGGLLVIGVDYPLLLALIAGSGELVPIVGPILAAVPAVAIALVDSPRQALVVLLFYLVMQQIQSNVLLPVVMRRQADVPPLLSLFALLAGSAVGGLLGALIAIPVAGALRVLVVRVVAPAERRQVGAPADGPAEPVPPEDNRKQPRRQTRRA